MSYNSNSHDDIVVEDHKRDFSQASEEGLSESKSWEQVKAEAVRDEEWQHSLSLWQSLKINRAVSQTIPRRERVADVLGCRMVDRSVRMYHYGVLRHSFTWLSVRSTRF
jgi:hypothetical protein